MEEMLEKISTKNSELNELRSKLGATAEDLEKKDLESGVQINQLKKLVDHLQTKASFLITVSMCVFKPYMSVLYVGGCPR